MRKLIFTLFSLALCGSALAQYTNGYFIVNEGQYGNEPGLLNFYSNETGEISTRVYQEASGNTLGMTAEFAAMGDGKLFITSKQNFGAGGRLVVADAKTLQTLASYPEIDGSADTRGVAVAEETGKFYVGTNMGVYAYELSSLEQIGLVDGTSGDEASIYSPGMGDMIVVDGMLYVATPDGIIVVNTLIDQIAAKIEINNLTSVFEVHGKVYGAVNSCSWGTPSASDTEQFVEINPDFTIGRVYNVPMASANFWFTPKPCRPMALSSENAIVYCGGEGLNYLCKYNFETEVYTEKFVTFDGRQQMYGHCVFTDSQSDDVVVCTFQGYSSLIYWFNIYNGITGEVKTSVKMPGHYWFPAQVLKAMDDSTPTAIDELVDMNHNVIDVTYYNVAGQKSDKPFNGINVVVTSYSDGAKESAKVVF